MKKLLAMLCLICLLAAMLPLAALATEDETAQTAETAEAAAQTAGRASNACGENLTWSFSGGTLTISGSGEMDDYDTQAPPWANDRHSITRVVFTGGVTYIGANAFTDYDEIESVDFGSSLHTIGEQAFYLCDGLKSITLPASFRCFGQECFMGCQNLYNVYCLGGMPSFRGSCLWNTSATVYYPLNNVWPADSVLQLLNSYQFKITIQAGSPPDQQTAATVETTVPETTAPTVTETTAPTEAETVPETTAPETTAETTEPVTEAATEPTVKMTEPEWLYETYGDPEPQEQEQRSFSGLWFGLFLVTGTLSLILIGALIFRRRPY